MSMSLFWLIAMVLFGVLEAVTVGLTSIWFALGALGALAAAAASAPVIVQIVVFLGVSFLTLLLVRPLAQRFVNDRKVATNADRVIGREAVVTEDIDNIQGKGRVSISGADWTAKTEDDRPIPAGSKVQVLRIEGVKVIVAPAGVAGDPQQAQP
ncbi:NfeD family protein [Intestinimonas timonensis]|uniref:NfeD family protein n=1 Tax=Intestinimonas timonensis TaxID=1689270 RepID=UPI001031B6C6|nr:NfeD family protein [Intestinimonas timonensis]